MSKEIIYWKQRDGKLISVDEMDIKHLRNVLKTIIKKSKEVQKPSNLKGESAQLFNDMQMESDNCPDHYDLLDWSDFS